MRTTIITMMSIVSLFVSGFATTTTSQELLDGAIDRNQRLVSPISGDLERDNGDIQFDGEGIERVGGGVQNNVLEVEEVDCDVEYYDIFTGHGEYYDAVKWRAASLALDTAYGNWYNKHFQPWLDEMGCRDECPIRVEKAAAEPPSGRATPTNGCTLTNNLDKYGRKQFLCKKDFTGEGSLTCEKRSRTLLRPHVQVPVGQ